MKNAGRLLGVAVLVVAAAVMVLGYVYPSATLRYKITVNIDTPEGMKTGSAVREVFIQRQPEIGSSGPHIRPSGEAVVVDLGARGVVFALTSFDDYQVIFSAFPYDGGGVTVEGLRYYSQLKNVSATLKLKDYPILVTFKDINDPKSVTKIIETDWCLEKNKGGTCINEQFHIVADHFEELFGRDVKLESVEIEMTDSSITKDRVDIFLPKTFWSKFEKWWVSLTAIEKMNYTDLFSFKAG